MFDFLLDQLVGRTGMLHRRPEGLAFFRLARDLYNLSSVAYLGINISTARSKSIYVHCRYSDTSVKHWISDVPVCSRALGQGIWTETDNHQDVLSILVIPLASHFGEDAIFGVKASSGMKLHESVAEKLGVLGNYFHSHVLRINGHNSDDKILLSAKELACLNAIDVGKCGETNLSAREIDCLQWTAAGKTAWETSVILGISERTVRFHLNASREKLACATTTQAVAKAVVSQLIHVEPARAPDPSKKMISAVNSF